MEPNNYPPLPEQWSPELLRRCTMREILLLAGFYGILAVCDRLGYDEFVELLRKMDEKKTTLAAQVEKK